MKNNEIQKTIDRKINGEFHRESWYMKRVGFHREDGPAIIYCTGYVCWYYYGKYYSFEDWCKETKKTDEEIVMLKLKYPNTIPN